MDPVKRRPRLYLINDHLTETQRLACFGVVYPGHECERCRWMWECIKSNERLDNGR